MFNTTILTGIAVGFIIGLGLEHFNLMGFIAVMGHSFAPSVAFSIGGGIVGLFIGFFVRS